MIGVRQKEQQNGMDLESNLSMSISLSLAYLQLTNNDLFPAASSKFHCLYVGVSLPVLMLSASVFAK